MLRRGSVARFSLGRLLATAALLLTLSFIVFALLHLMPGDPAQNLLGVRSTSPEALAQVRAQYHLDEPFLKQYLLWLGSVVHGDLGQSIRSDESVLSLLSSRVVLTLQVATYAFVLTVLIAVPLGVFSAWRAGGVVDRGASTAAIVGVGAPSYAVGLLLLYVFGVRLGLFPVYGSGDGGLDRLRHLTLPAVTLAIGLGALVLKLTRTAVLAELDQDYVAFARSRGLSPRQIQSMVLRNAMLPVITSLGLVFTFLFGGTILVEVTFALQGIGSLLASSVTFKDIPVVQAVTLITAAVIALTALAVDLLYFAVDPRVRKRAAS
jgi:peptide/nickel transport system permease protein